MGKRKNDNNTFRLIQYSEENEVTGSCMGLSVGGLNILLDFGLIQNDTIPIEKRYSINKNKLKIQLEEYDYCLLSHSNFDHISALPYLAKEEIGFHGKIITTELTAELSSHILRDGQKIMESEVTKYNLNHSKHIDLLYTKEDVENVIHEIRGYSYNTKIQLNDKVYVELLPSGHIAGSCLIYITYKDEYKEKHFMYCPDMYVGEMPRPYTKSIKEKCYKASMVVLEGTYSNKQNHPKDNPIDFLENVIMDVCVNNNNILWIPCFSMQRSTQICYLINEIIKRNESIRNKNIPMYSCGKLTKLCHETIGKEKYNEFYDDKWNEDRKIFDNPFIKSLTEKVDVDHFVLNNTCKIVLSSSGAITNGYSSMIAESFIPNKRVHIVGCGYIFPESTLDKIVKGDKKVIHNGMCKTVRCKFEGIIPNLSGHVDEVNNIKWIKSFNQKVLKTVAITHCTEDGGVHLEEVLSKELPNVEIKYMRPKDVLKI